MDFSIHKPANVDVKWRAQWLTLINSASSFMVTPCRLAAELLRRTIDRFLTVIPSAPAAALSVTGRAEQRQRVAKRSILRAFRWRATLAEAKGEQLANRPLPDRCHLIHLRCLGQE